jgi:ribosomal protein S18 acetylase RimI-like enzyme
MKYFLFYRMSIVSSPVVRPATVCDLSGIMWIQSQCYTGDLIESEATFASIMGSGPYSYVAETEDGRLAGFLLAHPWPADRDYLPSLHSGPDDWGDAASCHRNSGLFVHDVSVLPEHRRRGVAKSMVDRALADHGAAFGWRISLVAVQGAFGFWSRRGFAAMPARFQRGLGSYMDPGAIAMEYSLDTDVRLGNVGQVAQHGA